MKYKIGVFGSAEEEKKALRKAEELGRELSKHNFIIITGAADGVPYQVASTAAKLGSEVWGYTPATSFEKEPKKLVSEIINRLDRL